MEEVGLSVRNLRFYKSQPWSFTDTLMVGFWCEVDGSDAIRVDHAELKEARLVHARRDPPGAHGRPRVPDGGDD